MLTNGSPWASRRVSHEAFDDVLRRFLLTLWNVYAFFVTYANADGFDPAEPAPPASERPLLDRWALSQLARTVRAAREGLDAYDATGAGRAIQSFVDDLSNWYVRRSRRRFWDPGGEADTDTRSAFHTLHECLVTVATLLAPFTPFVAEELWRNLAAGREGRPDSVHLADYPQPDTDVIDESLDEAMAAARQIVELGRRIRVEHKVRTRQPLSGAVVHRAGDREGLAAVLDVVRDELNVKEIGFAGSVDELGRWHAKPNFKVLGPRLGPSVKLLAAALADDDGTWASALAHGDDVVVATAQGDVSLSPSDVDLTQDVAEGYGIASDGGVTVALALELTDALRREGLARELVRLIQDARKAGDLDVSDRIDLGVETTGPVAEALAAHRDDIAGETLAVSVHDAALSGGYRQDAEIDGEPVVVTVRMAIPAS